MPWHHSFLSLASLLIFTFSWSLPSYQNLDCGSANVFLLSFSLSTDHTSHISRSVSLNPNPWFPGSTVILGWLLSHWRVGKPFRFADVRMQDLLLSPAQRSYSCTCAARQDWSSVLLLHVSALNTGPHDPMHFFLFISYTLLTQKTIMVKFLPFHCPSSSLPHHFETSSFDF